MGFLDTLVDIAEALDEVLTEVKEFEIVNHTGYEIREMYISESDNDDWEEDILGEEVLADGESWSVSVEINSDKSYWDIRTIDEDGDEEIYEHLEISDVSKVTLSYDKDGDARAEYI